MFGKKNFNKSKLYSTIYHEQIEIRESFVFKFLSKNLKIGIFRIIILPVVLYGCETWPLTLREKRRLTLFVNRVLRRINVPKKDKEKKGLEKTT